MTPMTISGLNQLDQADFIRVVGPVFEASPWIAGEVWTQRPFASLAQLYHALCDVVIHSDEVRQLALVRAHPDLVSRAALAGTLTRESSSEQAAAGLGRLSPEEIVQFQKNNAAYQEKFGFPFVICVRLNKKASILAGFDQRLKNTRSQELQISLEEIFKIAELRLRDLISG